MKFCFGWRFIDGLMFVYVDIFDQVNFVRETVFRIALKNIVIRKLNWVFADILLELL